MQLRAPRNYHIRVMSELRSQIVINGKRTPQRNSMNPQLFVQCRFCDGNHWSDQCVEYPTAKDRKLRIKDSCFFCLKRGHIAYKCLSNKTCFYCGRKNHHNRSLCPQKFTEKETKQVVDRATQHIMGDYQITEQNRNMNMRQQGIFPEKSNMNIEYNSGNGTRN